jgi:hypothetical protein
LEADCTTQGEDSGEGFLGILQVNSFVILTDGFIFILFLLKFVYGVSWAKKTIHRPQIDYEYTYRKALLGYQQWQIK